MKLFINFFRNSKFYYLFLLVFLGVSVLFRFFGIFTRSFPFTYDIGRDLIAAREIATLEKFTLIGQTTGFEGLFYGPSWYYILSIIYHPLAGDPALITGFIAITGVAVVLISYFLGKRISSKYFALVWSGLIAFSPAVINSSIQIWSPNMIPIFWILSYVIIYNIFRGKRLILNFFLLGIISSLIIDMEIVVGLLYSAGIAVAVLITQRKVLSIKNISVGFLGFLLVLIPRVIFDIRHENLLSKSFIQGISSMVLDGGSGGSVTPLAQKILLIFGSWSDTITLGNRSFGLVALILTTLASVAFYRYGNDKLKFFLKITLIAIVISILGILSFGHDIWGHYLMIFPLLFVTWVSIAFGLGFCIKKYKIILLIVAMGLIIFNMNIPDRIKEYSSPLWEGNASVYRNQISVIDYVYSKSGDEPFKYIVYTPPVHDYIYRYLFNWYGEKEYNKLPNEDNAQLLFVIMEPDYENPQRLTDWLKLRENDGEIIDETLVKGGITVQTRKLNVE